MLGRMRTVKNQVIFLMVLFALTVTLLVSLFSFYLLYTFQRKTTVQSVEFNLQLVAGVIEQDIRDMTILAKWCGENNQYIADYFASDGAGILGVTANKKLQEELGRSRAGRYVRRLAVVDNNQKKILQVGNGLANSRPVTEYNVGRLAELGLGLRSEWETVCSDPFSYMSDPQVLPFVCPVFHPDDRYHQNPTGFVFMAASVGVVTDILSSYSLSEDSSLYLTLGEALYRLEGNTFTKIEIPWTVTGHDNEDLSEHRTAAMFVRMDDGDYMAVTYPVRAGIELTQVFPNPRGGWLRGAWGGLLIAVCLFIVLLTIFVTFYLDRKISRPIARLHKKIGAIAEGDFSEDGSLESDSELGQMGKGINRLSRDVVTLMDSRLADEQHKRELEYRMLQNQINPHFMYNTLNSIKWMATLQNAAGIAEMTTALSRMLKTVSKDIRKMVPLREELSLLDDFMVIQHYRYGGTVTLVKQTDDPALLEALIPRFTLQPLVENAIFHGIEPKGRGTVTVSVTPHGRDVLVSVTDDGIGMRPEIIEKAFSADSQPGMFEKLGLRNVHERLRFAFGEEYGLSVESVEGSYTTMTLRLPVQE